MWTVGAEGTARTALLFSVYQSVTLPSVVYYTDLFTYSSCPQMSFRLFPRIGLAMKHSSSMKRCAADSVRKECAADNSLNRGRQAVVRMLGKFNTMGCVLNFVKLPLVKKEA